MVFPLKEFRTIPLIEFKNPSWNSLVIPISMVTVVFWIAIARDQTNKLTFFTWFFLFPRCSWKFQNPIVDFVWFLKNICRSTSENHKITMFGFSYIVEPTISMQIPHLNIHGNFEFPWIIQSVSLLYNRTYQISVFT